MAPLKTQGRIICEKECAKNKNVKDFTLATKIFNNPKYNGVFNSQENVRGIVRTIRGHNGISKRNQATQPKALNFDNSKTPKPFKEIVNTTAKVLLIDIETAPCKGFFWQLWKQNIGINQITNDWFILTWSAKWLFEETVYSNRLTSREAKKQTDKRIMQNLWKLLNDADIVVTHNGKKFDLPKINTRFILNGLLPPLPYQQIDTLDSIKKNMAFSSNKQEFLNIAFGSPRKLDTGGFELWSDCYDGKEEALVKMEEYNKGDVVSLEQNYLKLRPYIIPHPNMGLFIMDGLQRCPSCGSSDLHDCHKDYRTTVSVYELRKCNNCGANSRVRKNKGTLKEKNGILSSSPR